MNIKDIDEKALQRSKLFTVDELKFARVFLNLPTAGHKTKHWFNDLSESRYNNLYSSVHKKFLEM